MKRIATVIIILIAGSQSLFSLEKPADIELRFGASTDLYSDFSSVLTVNEGLHLGGYYNILEFRGNSFVHFGFKLGIKSGLLFEGANSMKRPFIPELFPLYIPLCPSLLFYTSLGSQWSIQLFSSLGPYITLFNNFIPDMRMNIEGGIGISWYCFGESGLSANLKYSRFGKYDYWSGFGLNLLFIRKIQNNEAHASG